MCTLGWDKVWYAVYTVHWHVAFYRAWCRMETQSSDENSLCLSVWLSVKRMNCDKREEKSVQIFIPNVIPFSRVFWEEEWLMGCDPLYRKFWVNQPPLERNRRFWTDIRSAWAVTASENSSINTNKKSTTSLLISLRWPSYVASKFPRPRGGSKMQNGRFRYKNRTSLEESLLQSFFVLKLSATKL